MPKLIDGDELREWINGQIKEIPHGESEGEFKLLEKMLHLLASGAFDPTPVQPDTLSKSYKCPNCERLNIAEAWNYATAAQYGAMEITRIDETGCMDSSFVCPYCGAEEDYGRLEVIR